MIKFISVNVEGDRHLVRLIPFLEKEKPDVLCLQEVLREDVPIFEKTIRGSGVFLEMGILPSDRNAKGKDAGAGLAIVSRYPLIKTEKQEYWRSDQEPSRWDNPHSFTRMLLSAEIRVEEQIYRIATTHFTWTFDGKPDKRQERDLAALLRLLEAYPDLVLAGDFNAPRGLGIFEKLAQIYTDNIPASYDTSLDPDLHATKGTLKYVVEGLFTSPEYQTQNVRLQFGVSDHAAIVATLKRSP